MPRPRVPAPPTDRNLVGNILLGAATEEFALHGFHGTTMRQIAAAGGQTKPTLYALFYSKHDLYLTVLKREEANLTERLISPLRRRGQERTGDLRSACDDVVRLIWGYQCERPAGFTFLLGSENWRLEGERRRRATRRIVAAVVQCIQPHLGPASSTRPITAQALACAIVAAAIANGEAATNGTISRPEAATMATSLVRDMVGLVQAGTT